MMRLLLSIFLLSFLNLACVGFNYISYEDQEQFVREFAAEDFDCPARKITIHFINDYWDKTLEESIGTFSARGCKQRAIYKVFGNDKDGYDIYSSAASYRKTLKSRRYAANEKRRRQLQQTAALSMQMNSAPAYTPPPPPPPPIYFPPPH